MKRILILVLLPLAAWGAACGRDGSTQARLPAVRVILTQGSERLVVKAEVAADDASRARGLMNRPRVPSGTGMLFVYPGVVRRPFHMKDTLVELHVMFIREGRVVEIRNMRPCHAEPCPLTTPRVDYDLALEVPMGTLGRFVVGARVDVFGPLPNPS